MPAHKPYTEHIDRGPAPHHDSWVCLCGNTPESEGFDPATEHGDPVEPVETEWDGIHYRCDRCARVIDQRTGRVVNAMRP